MSLAAESAESKDLQSFPEIARDPSTVLRKASASLRKTNNDRAVRIARNLPQRLDVAAILRTVDRGGQLFVGRQLVRLVGEAVGVGRGSRVSSTACAARLAHRRSTRGARPASGPSPNPPAHCAFSPAGIASPPAPLLPRSGSRPRPRPAPGNRRRLRHHRPEALHLDGGKPPPRVDGSPRCHPAGCLSDSLSRSARFTVFELPAAHQRRLRTPNALERVNQEFKRRTRVASIFPQRSLPPAPHLSRPQRNLRRLALR